MRLNPKAGDYMIYVDEKRDYFGFNNYSGGYCKFEGILANGKEIDNISASINENNSTVTIETTYSDENVKRFESSYEFSNNDNTVTLSNIKKYWNDTQVGGETE